MSLLSLLGIIPEAISLGKSITGLIQRKAELRSDVEKANIDASVQELQARRDILIAEAKQERSAFVNACMRGFLAIPAGIALWKLIVWDKVIGSFKGCAAKLPSLDCVTHRTDAFDANMWWVILGVVGFYFVTMRNK